METIEPINNNVDLVEVFYNCTNDNYEEVYNNINGFVKE